LRRDVAANDLYVQAREAETAARNAFDHVQEMIEALRAKSAGRHRHP